MGLIIALVAINTLLTVTGQIILKIGMNKLGNFGNYQLLDFVFRIFTSPYVLGGLSLFAIAIVSWLALLSKVDLSFAYPTLALGYVLIFLYSYFFLGEDLNAYRIGGLVFVLIGIVLIFRS